VWIILAHSTDASALWAFQRLRARPGVRVEFVAAEALDSPMTYWAHTVGGDGACADIRLATGQRLSSPTVTAVLNRLVWPPAGQVAAADPADAGYARTELTAFAASWLRSLAPVVVNQPTPQGLCGRWRPPLHWRVLGMRAGLPVVPLHLTSAEPTDAGQDYAAGTTVLTIGGELLDSRAPQAIRRAARRLATAAETEILGLRFAGADPAAGGWRLLDATPQPDLSSAGDTGIEALRAVLAR
jgi:hypothetical protein